VSECSRIADGRTGADESLLLGLRERAAGLLHVKCPREGNDYAKVTTSQAKTELPLEPHGFRVLTALDYLFSQSYDNQERIKRPTNAEIAKRVGCTKRPLQLWRGPGRSRGWAD